MGGVGAGIVLGPTILGRVMPQAYESLFVGGGEELRALEPLVRRGEADRIAAEEAGLSVRDMGEQEAERKREQEPVRQTWKEAKWAHQGPLRFLTSVIVALTLLGAGAIGVRRSGNGQSMVGAISVGAWSAALPGALAFFAMRWWWNESTAESALVAAATAIGPWALTSIDREAADQAEVGGARMIQTAGRIAAALAVITAGWALSSGHGKGGLLMATPLLAAPLGWLIPQIDAALVRRSLDAVVLPAVAAAVAVKIDLYDDFSLWPIALFLLLSGDGRWLGAFTGAMIPGGRSGLRTMRLVLGSMAAGPTQLAITAIAVHTWSIPGGFAMALLLGAVVIEVTTPARRKMARRLIQTEEEIEQLMEE